MKLKDFIHSFFKAFPCFFCNWIDAWKRLHKRWKDRCAYFKEMKRLGKVERCDRLPPNVYKQPDPTIYSQHYLASLGYAITWNNPDIQLKQNGIPIPSDHLEADTEYEIEARIWNGSNEAPAIGMPVDFSFDKFGITTISNPIGQTIVNLPVRGAPGHPAFTTIKWRTPVEPGHYCLRVNLIWNDDANPANNLGQENCDVGKFNSPTAKFQFSIRNDFASRMTYNLFADSYQIPELSPCPPVTSFDPREKLPPDKIRERRTIHLSRNNVKNFPIPEGWKVDITPQNPVLSSGQEQIVDVAITAPQPDFVGEKVFNVNAYAGGSLIGGVTLTAKN